jgi:hypothetical protein
MAKAITPDEVMKKWAENGANSQAVVRAGVNAVTESPTAKAAARVDAWVQGVQRAKEKFVNACNAVSLNDWKQAMLGKGLQNMQTGYNDAGSQRKYLQFMRSFLPYVRSGAAQVRQMPKGTLADSIKRAEFMIRWNADYRNNFNVAPMPRPVG